MINIQDIKVGTKVRHIPSNIIMPVIAKSTRSFAVDVPIAGWYCVYEEEFKDFEIHSQPALKKQVIITLTENCKIEKDDVSITFERDNGTCFSLFEKEDYSEIDIRDVE